MALNSTTISAALNIYNTQFGVASATGVVAPAYSSGAPTTGNITYGYADGEMMQVTAVTGTFVSVIRGVLGTVAVSHNASAIITFGTSADFVNFTPAVTAFAVSAGKFVGFASPVAITTNAITATGQYMHVTGTTILKTITLAAGFVEGTIGLVFDGSGAGITWDATGNISVAGTAGTAGTLVLFSFDQSIGKWIPHRIL